MRNTYPKNFIECDSDKNHKNNHLYFCQRSSSIFHQVNVIFYKVNSIPIFIGRIKVNNLYSRSWCSNMFLNCKCHINIFFDVSFVKILPQQKKTTLKHSICPSSFAEKSRMNKKRARTHQNHYARMVYIMIYDLFYEFWEWAKLFIFTIRFIFLLTFNFVCHE